MRLLIVTHGLLTPELGASQTAINLASALSELDHEVILWTPQPLPQDTRWWQTLQAMRDKLDEFLKGQQRFDVIECPASLVTRRVSKAAPVIVRSTQPDILYLRYGLRRPTADIDSLVRLPLEYAYNLFHLWLVLQGWRRAQNILCLGTVELRWMQKWFPWWRRKLKSYVNALSASERGQLANVRNRRLRRSTDHIRFLWIGRWTAHKGTDLLLDFITRWAAQRPRDTFTIAGCGDDAEKDCPVELLASGTIKIIPSYPRSDLVPLLADHDIGLFTSKVEGWGLSLNEMLESGIPVFATTAGGVEDLRPFFKGLLPFPPSHNEELAPIEHEMLSSYYRTFSWSRVAQNYSDSLLTLRQRLASSRA